MEQKQHIKLLQMAYAGALADAVMQYDKTGVLANVTERKRQQQMATGAMIAKQFGVSTPEEAFTKLVEVFGCANWQITPNDDGFTAESTSCLLCGLTKKMRAASPCDLYCLNPIAAMVKAVTPGAEFELDSTLWDGPICRVRVKHVSPEG